MEPPKIPERFTLRWSTPTIRGILRNPTYTLRSRDDAAALHAALAAGPERVLIIGAGFIGCVAAAACRGIGLPVTLVDPNPTPLAAVLGTRVGRVVAEMLRREGVDYRPETRVEDCLPSISKFAKQSFT